jgi:hypothetical protein
MSEEHDLPPEPTVTSIASIASIAAPLPDAPDDFPSEEDVERRRATQAPRTAPSPAAAVVGGHDFATEFPSEKAERKSDPATIRVKVPRAVTPPRTARLGQYGQAAWWIAAACAVLAIAEAGIIAGRIPWRWGNSSGATGLNAGPSTQIASDGRSSGDSSRSGPGSAQPTLSQGGATPHAAPNPTSDGQLDVTSDPVGARVSVDDRAHGLTPATISVSPGPHIVVVSDGTTTSRQTVNVVAGGTATFMASFAPAAVSAGWVSIHSPLDLQVREGNSLIGATSADRLMMPAGRHVLNLSNADAAFQTSLTVVVDPGKTATSTVAIPNGSLSLNALPWANVTIDGQALSGTTPFADLQVPLGPHEIVWTHPQLGERRQTVMVNAKAPVRLVVDLRVK